MPRRSMPPRYRSSPARTVYSVQAHHRSGVVELDHTHEHRAEAEQEAIKLRASDPTLIVKVKPISSEGKLIRFRGGKWEPKPQRQLTPQGWIYPPDENPLSTTTRNVLLGTAAVGGLGLLYYFMSSSTPNAVGTRTSTPAPTPTPPTTPFPQTYAVNVAAAALTPGTPTTLPTVNAHPGDTIALTTPDIGIIAFNPPSMVSAPTAMSSAPGSSRASYVLVGSGKITWKSVSGTLVFTVPVDVS